MSKLKLRLILFFTSLLLLTYLEITETQAMDGWSIHPVLICIILFVLILELLVPFLRRIPVLVSTSIWSGLYLALRWFVIAQPPISLVEMLVWGYLVALAHLVVQSMGSLDDAIRYASQGGQTTPAISLVEAQRLIRAELTRSRHYNRPFSVIAVRAPGVLNEITLDKFAAEIRGDLARNHIKSRLARKLRAELRAMDLVLDDPESGNLLLLCPEVNSQDAELLMDHLSKVLERDYGLRTRMVSASFPDASPTFDGLLDLINEHLQATRPRSSLRSELAKSSSHLSE